MARLRPLCTLLLGCAAALCAWAGPREALVIGNADYQDVPLRNPVNDAQAVAQTLTQLGFRTRLVRNARWRDMIQTTQAFITDTEDAEMRLLYYAGHGAQVRGRNYLIPVDSPMDDVDELAARSLDAAEILARLARHGKGVNLLILDACRNNPMAAYQLTADGRRIKMRGGATGLLPMLPPPGALVAFATAPGGVSDDGGAQQHSLYTRHLLKQMVVPGVSLEQMFKRVRVGVLQDSAQRQRPWEESSLTVDYCLAPRPGGSPCTP